MHAFARRAVAALLTTVGFFGVVSAVSTPAAFADKTKDCGTTTAVVGPGNSGFTQTTTTTQTSSCNSNSDTGRVVTTGPVTNRGGGTPPGQQ